MLLMLCFQCVVAVTIDRVYSLSSVRALVGICFHSSMWLLLMVVAAWAGVHQGCRALSLRLCCCALLMVLAIGHRAAGSQEHQAWSLYRIAVRGSGGCLKLQVGTSQVFFEVVTLEPWRFASALEVSLSCSCGLLRSFVLEGLCCCFRLPLELAFWMVSLFTVSINPLSTHSMDQSCTYWTTEPQYRL